LIGGARCGSGGSRGRARPRPCPSDAMRCAIRRGINNRVRASVYAPDGPAPLVNRRRWRPAADAGNVGDAGEDASRGEEAHLETHQHADRERSGTASAIGDHDGGSGVVRHHRATSHWVARQRRLKYQLGPRDDPEARNKKHRSRSLTYHHLQSCCHTFPNFWGGSIDRICVQGRASGVFFPFRVFFAPTIGARKRC